ncbi:MAG: hypothetical protein KAG66_21355 [Methylococcales bacterium]|nr:hypothetical protein [Methylococcales bacterium]
MVRNFIVVLKAIGEPGTATLALTSADSPSYICAECVQVLRNSFENSDWFVVGFFESE